MRPESFEELDQGIINTKSLTAGESTNTAKTTSSKAGAVSGGSTETGEDVAMAQAAHGVTADGRSTATGRPIAGRATSTALPASGAAA